MSKVIHLSDEAHHKAKEFCREHGLKMSDWVANLIEVAISNGVGAIPMIQSNVRALVQKKKPLELMDDPQPTLEDGLPVYAAPPFWAKANGR